MNRIIYVLSLLFLSSLFALQTHAQTWNPGNAVTMPAPPSHEICTIDYTGIDADHFVRAGEMVAKYSQLQAASTITVNYLTADAGEWPQDAMAAFDYAVSIWEAHLQSDVTIVINATWRTFDDDNVLGSASPATFVGGFGAEDETWYAVAQASAMTGNNFRQQFDLDSDIEVSMNADFGNWYFGTDANTPPNRIDFTTVVLHEIGHGIGFVGSMRETSENSSIIQWGFASNAGDSFPVIYDRFTEDGDNVMLIDENVYGNPSSALFNALTGSRGGVFFDGESSNMSNLGEPVTLYTPTDFRQGSTYSHLDQVTYTGTDNALMRPRIDSQLAIHTPGPVFCGMLDDKGWPLGGACLQLLGDEARIAVSEETLDFGISNVGTARDMTLSITNLENAEDPLRGRIEIEGAGFSLIGGSRTYSINPGRTTNFTIRYRPQDADIHEGSVIISHNADNQASPIIVPVLGEALEENRVVALEQSYPNPVNPYTHTLQIPYVISEQSNVQINLYDISGQHVARIFEGEQNEGRYLQEFDGRQLASGVYLYRIVVHGAAETGKLMILR
ncbi:choice-of-anchor D domain-containing protein [Rhodohalobacter sp. SW132]|uniref:choice-of-anchor D domain-containing protein n=1 Tax=Rhodohalobacter sp. SW132 TaxID=2293433 RepID=UPI0011C04527|nr:choice-of-anchor D domain-containing protein [Rhodohalobacter sp. SW132]